MTEAILGILLVLCAMAFALTAYQNKLLRAKLTAKPARGRRRGSKNKIKNPEAHLNNITGYFGPPEAKPLQLDDDEMARYVSFVNQGRIEEAETHFDPNDEFRTGVGVGGA